MSRPPRVLRTTPAQTHQEEDQASCEENHAEEIHTLDLLYSGPILMQQAEVRRMIAEKKQDNGYAYAMDQRN